MEASDLPTLLCPVCGRLFKDTHGRGGHLATFNDEPHRAYWDARAPPAVEAPPEGSPTAPLAHGNEMPGPGVAIAGLLGSAFALAALVKARRAPAPRPPASPEPAEDYWTRLLGSAAVRRRP